MTRQTKQWARNVEGLRSNALKRAQETRQRAQEALTQLIREQQPINFKTVAQTAGTSTAWLYANEDIKQRIVHLRAQQSLKAPVKIPSKEQASNASKEAMIAALQKRIREQAQEIKALRTQLETAYEYLYQQQRS